MSGSEGTDKKFDGGQSPGIPIPVEMSISITEHKFREWVLIISTVQAGLMDIGHAYLAHKLATVVGDMTKAVESE